VAPIAAALPLLLLLLLTLSALLLLLLLQDTPHLMHCTLQGVQRHLAELLWCYPPLLLLLLLLCSTQIMHYLRPARQQACRSSRVCQTT
jgi:hypothetical protein